MTLTVACVWVNGHVPFTVEYVARLRAMVSRALARPFRFVCFTDRPHALPTGVEAMVIPTPARDVKGWWSKLELFNAAHGLAGRVLYLDLDTLIVEALDAIVDYPAPFALAPHAGDFNGKGGLLVIKRFNSSVMVWDAGVNARIFDAFTPDVPRTLWGDQDWIGSLYPGAAAMPLAWFPRLSAARPPWPGDTKVVLCKKPKNVEAAGLWPWFREAWG